MYTKYLTDRGQRLAFIETHKAMEHKKDSEKEYQRTQKLLDSSEYLSHVAERKITSGLKRCDGEYFIEFLLDMKLAITRHYRNPD